MDTTENVTTVKKFTNAQWDLIKLTLTPEQVEDFTKKGMVPSREGSGADRLSEEARRKMLMEIVGEPSDAKPGISVNITAILDAGFPNSAASAPYWSGLAGGSMVAWSLGWTGALRAYRQKGKNNKPGDLFRLDLELHRITQDDIAPRKAMWEKRFKTPFPYPPGFAPVKVDNGEVKNDTPPADSDTNSDGVNEE